MKKRNILQSSEVVVILHVLSTSPDLSKINWTLSTFPFSEKVYVINFSHLHKFAYSSKAQLIRNASELYSTSAKKTFRIFNVKILPNSDLC